MEDVCFDQRDNFHVTCVVCMMSTQLRANVMSNASFP